MPAAKTASAPQDALTRGLSDPGLVRDAAFIDGVWVGDPEGAAFEVSNPANGAVIARVAQIDAADSRRAIDAADRAFGPWAALLPQLSSRHTNCPFRTFSRQCTHGIQVSSSITFVVHPSKSLGKCSPVVSAL